MTDQQAGKSLGKGMLYIFWIAVLGVGTMFFNQWIEKRNNPNQQPNASRHDGVNEVTLERNRHHHYVASGSINGRTVTFMLDTGATQVAVPMHLADELGLSAGAPASVMTANGLVQARTTTIDRIDLGTIQWNNVPAHLNPGMRDDQILLGMSALKNVEFTQKDGTLTLKQYY